MQFTVHSVQCTVYSVHRGQRTHGQYTEDTMPRGVRQCPPESHNGRVIRVVRQRLPHYAGILDTGHQGGGLDTGQWRLDTGQWGLHTGHCYSGHCTLHTGQRTLDRERAGYVLLLPSTTPFLPSSAPLYYSPLVPDHFSRFLQPGLNSF